MQAFILIFLILSLLSCTNTEKNKQAINGLDYCNKEIVIHINKSSDMDYTDASVFYEKDSNTDYISLLSDWDNTLKLFNTKNGKLEKLIQVPECPRGFYIENLDSIYIITDSNNLLLIDEYSNVEKKVIIKSALNLTQEYNALVWARIPIIKDNQNLYFRLSRLEYLKNKFFDSLVVAVNIDKNFEISLDCKIGTFPIKYFENDFYDPGESYALNSNGDFVFAFFASDSVDIYNKKGKKIQSVEMKSKYLSDLNPLDIDMQDKGYAKQSIQYADTVGGYRGIFYDKYRKVYYRQVLLSQTEKDSLGRKNLHKDRKWTVIVADSNLKTIGEFMFPAREFDINGVFVGKDGLYIPHTHPHSKKYSEDKIVFSVFNIDGGLKHEAN